jgi:hypothetical protein
MNRILVGCPQGKPFHLEHGVAMEDFFFGSKGGGNLGP